MPVYRSSIKQEPRIRWFPRFFKGIGSVFCIGFQFLQTGALAIKRLTAGNSIYAFRDGSEPAAPRDAAPAEAFNNPENAAARAAELDEIQVSYSSSAMLFVRLDPTLFKSMLIISHKPLALQEIPPYLVLAPQAVLTAPTRQGHTVHWVLEIQTGYGCPPFLQLSKRLRFCFSGPSVAHVGGSPARPTRSRWGSGQSSSPPTAAPFALAP